MTVCSYCGGNGDCDVITRCYHDYHWDCLLFCVDDDYLYECCVCKGPINRFDMVETLIREFYEGKVDLSGLDEDELEVLCTAISQKKENDFESMYNEIFKVKDMKEFCLYEAVSHGHLEAFKWLIGQNIDYDKKELLQNWKDSCTSENPDILKYFLELELMKIDSITEDCEFFKVILEAFSYQLNNTNNVNDAINYVFFLCCQVGSVEMVNMLLEKGVKIDSVDPSGYTALHFAVKNYSRPEVIDFLLDKGIKLSEENHSILNCINFGHESAYEIAEKLIGLGANVHGCDKEPDHFKPIWRVVEAANMKSLKLLLRNGIKIDDRFGKDQVSILYIANFYGRNLDFIKELIDLGANVKAIDGLGKSALHYVGEVEILEFYLSAGLDVTTVDKDGNSPLHVALYYLNENCYNRWVDKSERVLNFHRKEALKKIELLVERGADVNLANFKGVRPIHLLVDCPHFEILKYLISKGAHVSPEDVKVYEMACKISEEKSSSSE